jgi:Predicted membrane protein (DUF2306)
VTHLGFAALATLTFAMTVIAFREIRRRNVLAHREWMVRSYSLLFAAVTLRLELPLLVVLHAGAFTPAYQIVSWLCWVPNLVWAEWYIRRTRTPRYVSGLRLTVGETLLPSSSDAGRS